MQAAEAAGVGEDHICKMAQLNSVRDLPQGRLAGAIKSLNARAQKRTKK